MPDPETALPPYVYHRVASGKDDGGTTHWYELAHAQCARALPSGSQLYTAAYPPGVFDVDIYDCELCGGIIGHDPKPVTT